ncbi:MAG: hypothetical protein JWP12_1978 [Bacteroidetes bacterium]|nr:hypothetical protein [Bacteroidota bacterium]
MHSIKIVFFVPYEKAFLKPVRNQLHRLLSLSQNKALLTAAVIFFAGSGIAQNSIGRLNELSLQKEVPFTVTQYSTKDGLTQSQVADIIENSDGSLFLSTANGISTFNGYEFSEPPIDKKYRYHFFDRLYWSNHYHILYGKDFNTSRLVQLLPVYKMESSAQYSFYLASEQNDSLILCDVNYQLYSASLPDFKITKLNCKIPVPPNYLYYYNHIVYCATTTGLYTYNMVTHTLLKITDEPSLRVKANPFNHHVYALTRTSVFEVNDSVKKIADIGIQIRDPSDMCKGIEFVSDSEFYVTTNQGLFFYSPEYTQHYTFADGLPSESLSSLHYNKAENCLFVGTEEKGLLKLQFKTAYSLFKKEGFAASSLNSIIKTSDGKVLVGENCCRVYQMKIDTVIPYNNIEGSYACIAEIDKNIYCGTWGAGVLIMHDGKVTETIAPPAIPGSVVFSVFKDRQGYTWVGTHKGVGKGMTPETIKPVFSKEINSKIVCMYQLRNGNICLGGENGFYIVSENKVEKIVGKEEGLNAKEVRSFLEDKEGKLWIGTYSGGVYCYEKNKLTSINAMKNCMLFEDAFCLAIDDFGQLFMSSNYGLWKISYKALDDFYKGKTDFLIPEHYTQENGILNTEFNGGFQNNYLKTKQGHFYFPTIEGVVVVTPDTPTYRKLFPKIVLTKQNKITGDSGKYIFERNISVINFKASCVNFSERFNVYFQYKVVKDEIAQDWSAPQKESDFSFYQLPPGNYKFVIRAIDSGNDTHPVETVFNFRILPYFYETNWFKLSVALLICALTIMVIRWRTKKNKELLEKENTVKRQLAELQLEGIQAQMNPHFVFNCLNTIQALFITGQTKLANEYTARFSSLMRLIIEHIRKRKISIREEMELLEIYLPLENIQLENAFDFSIKVDAGIDKDNTLIHGMIIHTFVENAIKHGIKPRNDRKGIITIRFKKEGETIVVEITDNGNGINYMVNKKQTGSKHISRGLQIIKERINIINLLENINIYTETIDLSDVDKNKTGTVVRIIYPIQHDTDTHR